jgi:hypothetical protein
MPKPKAEICLYGCRSAGFDFLACTSYFAPSGESKVLFTPNGMEAPKLRYESCTEALWAALEDLLDYAIIGDGVIAVFAPGGERVAYATASELSGTSYGSMKWEAAPVMVIEL